MSTQITSRWSPDLGVCLLFSALLVIIVFGTETRAWFWRMVDKHRDVKHMEDETKKRQAIDNALSTRRPFNDRDAA